MSVFSSSELGCKGGTSFVSLLRKELHKKARLPDGRLYLKAQDLLSIVGDACLLSSTLVARMLSQKARALGSRIKPAGGAQTHISQFSGKPRTTRLWCLGSGPYWQSGGEIGYFCFLTNDCLMLKCIKVIRVGTRTQDTPIQGECPLFAGLSSLSLFSVPRHQFGSGP